MTEIEELVICLQNKESFGTLYSLCKKMRELGVEANDILSVINDFSDKNEKLIDEDEEFEDVIYDLMSCLVGYCNSSYSLI